MLSMIYISGALTLTSPAPVSSPVLTGVQPIGSAKWIDVGQEIGDMLSREYAELLRVNGVVLDGGATILDSQMTGVQVPGKCSNGDSIVIVFWSRLRINPSLEYNVPFSPATAHEGSGGNRISIFAVRSDGSAIRGGDIHALDILASRAMSGTCPDFKARLHGSYFQRVGSQTGCVWIRFEEGRYEVVPGTAEVGC